MIMNDTDQKIINFPSEVNIIFVNYMINSSKDVEAKRRSMKINNFYLATV